MNPLLTDWLEAYNEARTQYRDETRLLPVDALMPERPREMQFTITSTGLLRDADGRRICRVTDLSTLDLRQLGVDPERLTRRQLNTRDRTPAVPRRNPDTTRQPVTSAEHDNQQSAGNLYPEAPATDAAPAVHVDPATVTSWEEDFIPFDAAPGDLVVRDGERVGIVGRNGRNEVVVVHDAGVANPMHTRLRRPLATVTAEDLQAAAAEGDPILANLRTAYAGATTLPQPAAHYDRIASQIAGHPLRLDHIAPGAIGRINEAISNMAATAGTTGTRASEVMAAAIGTRTPAEPEVYVGPRMLATIAQPAASAERFTQHTADAEHAHLRAGQIYHQRPNLYAAAVRRVSTEAPNGAMVDRNAAAVTTFLSEGYGIELNEEALSAVTAMANTFIRQAAIPLIARADGLQVNVASLDGEVTRARENSQSLHSEIAGLRNRLNAVTPAAPATPAAGTVEAAFLAAKAWKETGISDSVAKLASFKHLLDTLEALAR